MSWSYFPTPSLPAAEVRAFIPALTIITEALRPFHAAGAAAGDATTPEVLSLPYPDSVQAVAYRFGMNRLALNFDDLRGPSYVGRHHLAEDVEYSAPVLVETGGHGESHKDNRDMVDSSELAVA